ncbi:hypothetical protein CPJCM30710_03210 [Clostridium polyendosporum]|uniref:Serine protease n=1 Tax=Clostridium polyendosporum TaxID=69208 RepID=A0A919RY87_9CLOT|nr:endonuclease [Clostridium polyendosporum]GIM27655.1 hypothetical protein CPJCM30710_03210 [Clostridium polyendosporum]
MINTFNKNKPISLIGKEYALKGVNPLEPKVFRDLVKRRAMDILNITPNNEEWEVDESVRKEVEKNIYEKIHKENNLLPVDFLYKGVEKARAVCRISTPDGLGTGFLIDKGMIMTNNHVIQSKEIAEQSFAEFYYEADKQVVKVKLKPEDIFITSVVDDLDFTIVSCENLGIEDIKPVHLLRSSVTITRGEFVNIIQHPNGRKKEVALQDNKVTYVYDKVIRYNTDTEPGSSGSAVFNNKWELVALHHAGWFTDDNNQEAENEGIRISAIVNRLIKLANEGNQNASRILTTVEGTSPYLGLFDVHGLIQNEKDLLEVEIPSFKGDKRFADIGFWNIEHFNNSVNQQRVTNVAKIVANLSMDVLGLVEVENSALDRLVVELKKSSINMNYVYLNAEGTQDLAVLYDVETTNVELRNDINEKYKSILSSKTNLGNDVFPKKREPLFVKCIVKEEDKDIEFLMIVVHLKAFGDPESMTRRKLAANIISVIIDDLRKDESFKNIPIVLGGDFNQTLDGDILGSLIDSPYLFTLTTDDAKAGYVSYIGNRFSLIDHIIVSNDVKLGSISDDDAAIVRLDKSIRRYVNNISDHVPLVVRLIYKNAGNIPEYFRNKHNSLCTIVKDEDSIEKTLLKLHINKSKLENQINYYNEEQDKLLINEYYTDIHFNIGDKKILFKDISKLVTNTHTKWLSYDKSKRELFSLVDLRENGLIKSIYSGKLTDPEELIREDYELEKVKKQACKGLLVDARYLTQVDKEEIIEIIESTCNCNVEHVVPQSWFNHKSPMKGDLHHLFTCEKACNQFRDDDEYYDFPDYNPESNIERTISNCGKGEFEKFEPESGKGEVARAVLYFLLRYPGKIKENRRNRINIDLLLTWHKEFPVSLYEKHRNKAIYELQGNRNPLIDFPQCANGIDFSLSLV